MKLLPNSCGMRWRKQSSADLQKGRTMCKGIILCLCVCISACGPSTPTSTTAPVYSDTELKLKKAYEEQGIEYDDAMLRDDARAIEALSREFD